MRSELWLLPLAPVLAIGALAVPPTSPSRAQTARAPDATGSLCARGEEVIFSCGVGRKMVSVCGGRATAPHAQYRYGAPGNIELAFPGPADQSRLVYEREAYSGGGALQIRFTRGGYDYAVYSRTIRTGFGRRGNNPRFSDGVMVMRGGRLVSNLACTTPVRGDAQPEDFMEEGTGMQWPD